MSIIDHLETGQTLIEVLTALSAIVVVISVIVSASLNALTNSEFTRDQNSAAAYTQAGIEILRNMRNQAITSINSTNLPDGTYCLADSCTQLDKTISSCWTKSGLFCPQNIGKFVRQVTIVHNATDCNVSPTPNGQIGILNSNVKVTMATAWFDSKCTNSSNTFCHSVVQSSCFSDFTILPTP